ncbi:MAG: DAHL domain-containing protein, partial [Spirulinaceae cyanobacterium]
YELLASHQTFQKRLQVQQELQNKLLKVPSFIEAEGQDELRAILREREEVMQQKALLVKDFQSKNALLRDSLEELPTIITELEESPITIQSKPLQLLLDDLFYKIVVNNFQGDEKQYLNIANQLEVLDRLKDSYPEKENELIATAISQSQAILVNKPKVNRLTAKILALPSAELSEELEKTYSNYYQKAIETTNIYSLIAYVLSLTIFACLAYIIIDKLVRANRKTIKILESITDAFLALDSHWNITYLNPQASQLLSQETAALTSLSFWQVFPEASEPPFQKKYYNAVKKGKLVTFEQYFASLQQWLEVRAYPHKEGLSIFLSNITKRKETEAALKRLNEELEIRVEKRTEELAEANEEIVDLYKFLQKENKRLTEVDRLKTDFISTVSHELRTPLTSVLGFTKLIKKKLEEVIFPATNTEENKTTRAIKQVKNNLNIIVTEGERLTALINDVLDLAKMEAGKVEWKEETVSIQNIAQRAIASTSALFEQKGLQIIEKINPELPEIIGDRDRLIQVLINLLSNAIKFTEEGSVTCQAYQEEGQIIFQIIDTGTGIALEHQDKVFQRFQQLGDTLTDKPQGTGLGLPICKQIVEHHSGKIWLESELNQGSTFSFSLPIPLHKPASAQKSNSNNLVTELSYPIKPKLLNKNHTPKSILVVDDDSSIRELLTQQLQPQGYTIRQAEDGWQAINQVKENKPDLIIMDVMMPQMNGLDAAAVLKNDPRSFDIPIIILSIVEKKERGYKIGVERYLNKPINAEELLDEISFLITQENTHKEVLFIEKEQNTVKILTEILQGRGYKMVETLNKEKLEEKMTSPYTYMTKEKNSELAQSLRFEKGLNNTVFIFLADKNNSASSSPEF